MTSSGDSDRAQANTNSVALQAVGADPTIITSGIIPGTQNDLEKLSTYAETGKGEIPEVYRILAANTNGKYSAWDIAEAQLQASLGKVRCSVARLRNKLFKKWHLMYNVC